MTCFPFSSLTDNQIYGWVDEYPINQEEDDVYCLHFDGMYYFLVNEKFPQYSNVLFSFKDVNDVNVYDFTQKCDFSTFMIYMKENEYDYLLDDYKFMTIVTNQFCKGVKHFFDHMVQKRKVNRV